MTNKDLVIYLKQLFDRFDNNKFVYGKKESAYQFNLIQIRNGGIISSGVGQLPFSWIHYTVITPKHLVEIKRQLDSLYDYAFKRNLYIDITLVNNGFKYNIIDYTNKNKTVDKGKLIFKSTPSWIYYFIYMLGQ